MTIGGRRVDDLAAEHTATATRTMDSAARLTTARLFAAARLYATTGVPVGSTAAAAAQAVASPAPGAHDPWPAGGGAHHRATHRRRRGKLDAWLCPCR